jgi:hypothetical protein
MPSIAVMNACLELAALANHGLIEFVMDLSRMAVCGLTPEKMPRFLYFASLAEDFVPGLSFSMVLVKRYPGVGSAYCLRRRRSSSMYCETISAGMDHAQNGQSMSSQGFDFICILMLWRLNGVNINGPRTHSDERLTDKMCKYWYHVHIQTCRLLGC